MKGRIREVRGVKQIGLDMNATRLIPNGLWSQYMWLFCLMLKMYKEHTVEAITTSRSVIGFECSDML